ncbi:MAG: FtsQ-type POTRA domain-containing protein [Clostridia bacterium]|nr:FtsQ-type POTRA domain-containing protein [Clostridia bacterium]
MAAKQQDEFTKKRNERRRRIRRRRAFISFIVLIIAALITFAVLSLTVLFPVKSVKAQGSKIYSASEIIKASGLSADDNILTFSESKVIKQIQTKLPFAETVSVKRSFPETVELTVSDAKEFACYPVEGKYYTVSRSGKVLNVYEACPEGLFTVRVKGVSCELGMELSFEDERTRKTAETMVNSLTEQGLTVNEIDITDPLSLFAKIDGRFTVNFGTSGSLEKKIGHLCGMVRSIAKERMGHINLSMWTAQKTEGTFTEKAIE